MTKYIYIAGPYSSDPAECTLTAQTIGLVVMDAGHDVFIPHLSHYMNEVCHRPYEFWMKQDFAWLRKCDALFRIKGESSGADREVALAIELKMPIWHNLQEMLLAYA